MTPKPLTPAEQAKIERVALILAEAVVAGDDVTAKKHGVSKRSIRRWRKDLESNAPLAEETRAKKELVEGDWANALPSAIQKSIAFLEKAADQCDATDPEAVHAIAGSMKLLTEVAMSRRLIDARLSKQAGQPGASNRPGDAAGAAVVQLRPSAASASRVHSGSE